MNHAKSSKLEKFEIPGAVTLTHIEWTPVRIFHLHIYTAQALGIVAEKNLFYKLPEIDFSGHRSHNSSDEVEAKATAGVLSR